MLALFCSLIFLAFVFVYASVFIFVHAIEFIFVHAFEFVIRPAAALGVIPAAETCLHLEFFLQTVMYFHVLACTCHYH